MTDEEKARAEMTLDAEDAFTPSDPQTDVWLDEMRRRYVCRCVRCTRDRLADGFEVQKKRRGRLTDDQHLIFDWHSEFLALGTWRLMAIPLSEVLH